MTKKFIERVKREGMVDTREYRYVFKAINKYDKWLLQIKRLPLDYLDTTAVFNEEEWEVVYSETVAK